MLFFFLWLTSPTMMISSPIHVAANGLFHFYCWVIFLCIYILKPLYLFICWWTFRLLPCLGYYKYCCNDHQGACIFLNYFYFLDVCPKVGLPDYKMVSSLVCFTCFCLKVKVAQLCPTLCDPMNYTFYGILQARILEWVAVPFSRGSS